MSDTAVRRVQGVNGFLLPKHHTRTLVEGLESMDGFDEFAERLGMQLLAERYFGDISRANEFEGSEKMWSHRPAKGDPREPVRLAPRFENRPLKSILDVVNPRILVVAGYTDYLDPRDGGIYRRVGRQTHIPRPNRQFISSVSFVALSDLVLKGESEVVGTVGLMAEEGYRVAYTNDEIAFAVKGSMKFHDDAHSLFPKLIPEGV